MTIDIRRINDASRPEYCRVVRDVFGDAPSPEILREQDERAEKSGALRDRYVVFDNTEAIGMAALTSSPFIPVQAVDLRLGIQRTHRKIGIGSAMLVKLEVEAARRGFRQLIASVTADDLASFEFAIRRAFEHQHDRYELELDLRQIKLEKPTSKGEVTVAPIARSADESERVEIANTLEDLITLSPDMRDLPKWDHPSVMNFLFDNPSTRPEWILLAREGAALVGIAVMTRIGERAYAFFTGVKPSKQRRGIARALKLACIHAAKRDGFGRVFTDNLSTNGAMLALNMSLGFELRRTARSLRKKLTAN